MNQVTVFADAQQAWPSWNLAGFSARQPKLLAFHQGLKKQQYELAEVCLYQLEQSAAVVAKPQPLVGPTGESNELYTAARGVALFVVDPSSSTLASQQSLIGMLTAALAAGNSAIICSDDLALNQVLVSAIKQAELPLHLVQIAAFDDYACHLAWDIRSLTMIGSPILVQKINRQLAAKAGPIVHLIAETEPVALHQVNDPMLVLNYITERTRTINITAVGGNAHLLALGNDAHR
ncbi:hypothetical protein [Motilimonas eburnea]|uniref:hypothetical protein n=1 Tax=Motilimonas eburnea TaxID=1737488 RepID=UPI001E48C0BB|nr:hypothetical protein [Motilimonas eburnea]MCE2570253.1 hypothetical protein [Motilimonas eburnea]